MSRFQQFITEYDERLKYDVEVHRCVKVFDLDEFNNIIKLCNDNDIKAFTQKFTLTPKMAQPNTSTYRIYDSKDIFGENCYYYDYDQGSEYYKIYEYESELKFIKRIRRTHSIRNLKLYKIKRVQRIRQETVSQFFKLNKGLE